MLLHALFVVGAIATILNFALNIYVHLWRLKRDRTLMKRAQGKTHE